MHKAMAQPNASVGELQSKPGFDIWPLSLPNLFRQRLQWMTMLKERERELSRDAKQPPFTPISSPPPPPYVTALVKRMISCQINSSIPCLWQHFWNMKAVLKPKLVSKPDLWPMRQDVFGVELRKLAFSSPTESGHPNSLRSRCFKNGVFQHCYHLSVCGVSRLLVMLRVPDDTGHH